MTDYGEPDLDYLLERLASLNHRGQRKSHRETSVPNEPWGRVACQKRRLEELKGQNPYSKVSRARYKCSLCSNVFRPWTTTAQHCKEKHFVPVAAYCMSCGYRLPMSRTDQHQRFCGWRILDADPNKPSRVWLCCLENLLCLAEQEVCVLIDICGFDRPDGRCNARSLALYFFQQLWGLAQDPTACTLKPSGELEERQEMSQCGHIYNEILAGVKGIWDIFKWVVQDKPIASRKLLIWDTAMFSSPNEELYYEFHPPLLNVQRYRWIRRKKPKITHFTLTHDPCHRSDQKETRKSIAGSTDVILPEGAGWAWGGARIPRQLYPGRYDWRRPLP